MASDFRILGNTCGGVILSPKSRCSISVAFTPHASFLAAFKKIDMRAATLLIADNAASSPQQVALRGTVQRQGASPASYLLTPGKLDFGTQQAGTQTGAQTVTLTNRGGAAVQIRPVGIVDDSFAGALVRANKGNFAIAGDTCSNATVPPGGQCIIQITFLPRSSGDFRANLSVSDTQGNIAQSVSLTGIGFAEVGWCCTNPDRGELSRTDARGCAHKGRFFLDEGQARGFCMRPVG